MDLLLGLAAVVTGYLIGSISFARVVTHFISSKTDLDSIVVKDEVTGDVYQKRPTANSVSMALGWQAGCAVSLLDMLKVTLPVLALKLLLPGQPYFLILAAAAVAGNNWPVFYGFRGGAGISAIYGGMLVVDPLAIVAAAVVGMVVGLLLLRSFLAMFLLSLMLVIPWLWWRFEDPAYWIYGVVVNILYMIVMVVDTLPYLRPGARLMSEREIMQQMPMGRGMIKMMDAMRFQKQK